MTSKLVYADLADVEKRAALHYGYGGADTGRFPRPPEFQQQPSRMHRPKPKPTGNRSYDGAAFASAVFQTAGAISCPTCGAAPNAPCTRIGSQGKALKGLGQHAQRKIKARFVMECTEGST